MEKKNFDAIAYFKKVHSQMKLLQNQKYQFCTCSGIGYMEGIIQSMEKSNAYFMVLDTNNGRTFMEGNSWKDHKTVTVFILKKYALNQEDKRMNALNECRKIYKLLVSRINKDRASWSNQGIGQLNRDIPYYELQGWNIAGTTGLYFTVGIYESINLKYDDNEWI